MEILIENLTSNLTISDKLEKDIENAINIGLDYLGYGDEYEISISIVDKDEIQQLNNQYRSKNNVTDVLTFPLYDKGYVPEFGMLGDIVICSDKVLEQSEEFGHTYQRELIYLTIHSLLHLLGYDHEIEEEKLEMRSKEKEIMRELGIFK